MGASLENLITLANAGNYIGREVKTYDACEFDMAIAISNIRGVGEDYLESSKVAASDGILSLSNNAEK